MISPSYPSTQMAITFWRSRNDPITEPAAPANAERAPDYFPDALGPAWLRYSLSDSMGAGEIALVAALLFIFYFSSQLPEVAEALKDRPDQWRRFRAGVFVILGALLLLALFYAITHALQGA